MDGLLHFLLFNIILIPPIICLKTGSFTAEFTMWNIHGFSLLRSTRICRRTGISDAAWAISAFMCSSSVWLWAISSKQVIEYSDIQYSGPHTTRIILANTKSANVRQNVTCVSAFCYPIEAISRILDNRHELPMILNVTVHFLTWVTLSGSSLSLILLNLDKLLYFKYPLR